MDFAAPAYCRPSQRKQTRQRSRMIAQDYQHHTMKNYMEGGQTMIERTILDRINKPASGFFFELFP
jgi:hypothetical protein